MALLSSAVCYTRINIIRDVSVADHFTCEMKGFPLQMCSLALWSAGHCKEGLHETVDSVLGKYFKWTSYLCLSLSPQAPDLKRQQWRERTRVSASNGLLNLYLATILKLINLWCCCPRVLCSEDITKAGLALVSLNIHWTSLRQVAPSAAPGPTKLSIRESINLALALTATSETCWRTGSLASPHTRSTTLHITIWGKAPLDMTILPRLASGCLGNAAVCGVESNCKITTSSRFQFKAFLHLLGLECIWNRILRTGGRTARYVVLVVTFGILQFLREVTEVLPCLFLPEHDALERLQEVEVQEHPQDIPLKFWTPAE